MEDDNFLPNGPSLHDFVSENAQDLPTFDPTVSHGAASENLISFSIFVDKTSKSKEIQKNNSLESVRLQIITLVNEVCNKLNHIWHVDRFNLVVKPELNLTEGHLAGSICFGDCIEDEWLIVFLLVEATKQDPSLSIIVRDNDGEFLLIETSPSWPRSLDWLEPENSNNRVWIRHGTLHIIDYCGVGCDDDDVSNVERGPLALEEALKQLRSDSSRYDKKTTTIRLGDTVELFGLISRKDLNGKKGRCIGASGERLVVELDDRTKLKIKAVNVVKVTTTKAPNRVVRALDDKLDAVKEAMRSNMQRIKVFLPLQIALLLSKAPHLIAPTVQRLYARDLSDVTAAAKCRKFGSSVPPRKDQALVEVSVAITKCLLAMLTSQESFHPSKKMVTSWSTQLFPRYQDELAQVMESNPFTRGLLITCGFEMLYQSGEVQWRRDVESLLAEHGCEKCTSSSSYPLSECCYCENTEWLDAMSQTQPTSEDWMNVTPAELEQILRKEAPPNMITPPSSEVPDKEEKDDGVGRLSKIVDGVEKFLDHSSGISGVDIPSLDGSVRDEEVVGSVHEGVSLDADKFMQLFSDQSEEGSRADAAWGDLEDSDDDDDDDVEDDHRTANFASSDEKNSSNDYSTTYSEALDSELSSETVSKSFERVNIEEPSDDSSDKDDEIQPVDVDGNLVKHLLESYVSQEGMAGPASNLLHEMGLFFPNVKSSKSEETAPTNNIKTESDSSSFFVPGARNKESNSFPLGHAEAMYELD